MKRILWIEDDYQRLEGLMRPLEKMGFEVDYATDYPSFLEKMKENYDLYVVDLILPQKKEGEYLDEKEYIAVTGLKVIEEIDKLNKPMIVVTVVTDPEIRSTLEKIANVKHILIKGNIFPSDFKSDVLGILGIKNAG